jgi:hypothetical protein
MRGTISSRVYYLYTGTTSARGPRKLYRDFFELCPHPHATVTRLYLGSVVNRYKKSLMTISS